MDITRVSVCFATLSAVRCLVPVSEVFMSGLGKRWVLAYNMRLALEERIIAPSIFASS